MVHKVSYPDESDMRVLLHIKQNKALIIKELIKLMSLYYSFKYPEINLTCATGITLKSKTELKPTLRQKVSVGPNFIICKCYL